MSVEQITRRLMSSLQEGKALEETISFLGECAETLEAMEQKQIEKLGLLMTRELGEVEQAIMMQEAMDKKLESMKQGRRKPFVSYGIEGGTLKQIAEDVGPEQRKELMDLHRRMDGAIGNIQYYSRKAKALAKSELKQMEIGSRHVGNPTSIYGRPAPSKGSRLEKKARRRLTQESGKVRPTLMGLETVKREAQVNRETTDIVGNNISNSKIKGHTRQHLDTVSVYTYGGSQYNHSSVPLAEQGVDTGGVAQIHNPYLGVKFRQQHDDVRYYNQRVAIMDQIEGIISDLGVEETGTKTALTTLSQALVDFSRSPCQETNTDVVMNAFRGVIQVLSEYDTNLKTLMEQTRNDLSVVVEDTNTKLDQLSELNSSIAREIFNNNDYDGVNYGPNDLPDQRSVILDNLLWYGDVQVTDLEDGRVQVKINGEVVVDASGASYTNDELNIGSGGITLTWSNNNQNANLGAGTIRGFTDMLTGVGPANAGISYYQNKMGSSVQTLADVFNNKIHVNDLNFPDKYKFLLQGGVDDKVTAGNISISDQWADDAPYVICKRSPDGKLGNQDILDVGAVFEQDFDFGEECTGTFSEFVTSVTNTLGSGIKTNSTRMNASLAIVGNADSERVGVSGVSLNEGGISMMTYNKVYQALGRLMVTMDEQLDMIINKMGVIGR